MNLQRIIEDLQDMHPDIAASRLHDRIYHKPKGGFNVTF